MSDIPTAEQLQARKDWVAALRSGNYKQGKYELYTSFTDSYCCLGVACAINGIKDPDGGTLACEPTVMNKLGVDRNPRVVVENKGSFAVSELNDHGILFTNIADYIEASLIKPFENTTQETA